jgi:anti-anti-sigma regulatory factor
VAEEVLRITNAHDQPWLFVAGEVDESSYEQLLQSLGALGNHRDIHIDLGGVEFCDLAGLRAIVCGGRPGEDANPDRQVCLHAVPPRLRKIMQILGWDDSPGLTLDARPLPADGSNQDQARGTPARLLGERPERPAPAAPARVARG